jgi:hypothetical protein
VRSTPSPGAHLLDRLQRRSAREHREPLEEAALRLVEQSVGPVDRRLERPVSGRGAPAGDLQQPEELVEPGRDVRGGERARPAGGKLDRQRQAVEPPADLGDGAELRRGVHDRAGRPRAVEEERDRGARARVGRTPAGRQIEPGQAQDLLAVDAQRRTTRRQEAQVAAAGEQALGDLGRAVEHVLAVVEDQQAAPRGEVLGDAVQPGAAEHGL